MESLREHAGHEHTQMNYVHQNANPSCPPPPLLVPSLMCVSKIDMQSACILQLPTKTVNTI